MKAAIKTRVIVIVRSLLIAGVALGPLGVRPPGTARAQPLSPRAALERLMTAPHYRADWFAPGFRVNGVSYSPAQLELGRASTEAQFGPFTGLRPQPGGSYLLVYRTAVQRTSLTLDGRGRVAAWELGAPKPKANRVDVGGYHLYIHCLGTGRPTVLLEAGLGSPSEVWGLVQPAVARFTRVCAYDRAGVGGSDAGPRPRTSATIVAELHTLLNRAGITGPYVLVGHSLGGFHVRLYAGRYPREVVGMVLVDASHPDQIARELAVLPPRRPHESPFVTALRDSLTSTRPEPTEGLDLRASAAQVRAVGSLGARPLVVLTRGRLGDGFPPDVPADVVRRDGQVWQDLQNRLARLSSDSTHVLARESGHFIQVQQPQLVIEAIRQVVRSARTHAALAPCGTAYRELGGVCAHP